MIKDLTGAGTVSVDADVLIVGAGTVGLVMAVELVKKGLKVVCLESGGRQQKEDEHPLNEVVHLNSVYDGAAHGRFRCLGGTSTRWGGALIPFLSSDLDEQHWPIDAQEVEAYRGAVESFFSLSHGSYTLDDVLGEGEADHVARLAKWPPFAKRNVANLLSNEIKTEKQVEIWLHATATRFDVEQGRLEKVRADAPDGSQITVSAREVIFAAGAIETTRLLLLLDQQNNGEICAADDQLGRHFHDHLSVVVARLEPSDRKALNRLIGFRFEAGGVMRNLRFELATNSPVRTTVRPCFAHIAIEEGVGGGFDVLRDLFRFIQQRRIPKFSILMQLVLSSSWLTRAVWWRYIENRLLYPTKAGLMVHMVVEQEPVSENQIALSASRKDIFGSPLAEMNWSVSERDAQNLTNAVTAFEKTWAASDLSKLAKFVRRPEGEAEAELAKGGGIYHPGGSTRMARQPNEGVVNKDLEVFRLSNLRLVATSVLPTGGGANPTMYLMMLAFRCVDQLAAKLKRT